MVDEGRKRSNGDVVVVVGSSNGDTVNNGVGVGVVNGFGNGCCVVGDGFSGGGSSGSDGLQTYKRQKRTRSSGSSEAKKFLYDDGKVSESPLPSKTIKEKLDMVSLNSSCDQTSLSKMDSHDIMNGSDDCSHRHWRNIVLRHTLQSLGESEGGIRGCIRDALAFHPESGCTTAVKESVNVREDSHKCPSLKGYMLNGSGNAAKGRVDVDSNGSLNESNQCALSELCQRTFFDIIMSENFAQVCNLLFENFQGMKVGSFFDFSPIDSRMKEGAYETSPPLFHSDIQQIWSKLQKVGTEMVTLAKSLSNKSRTSYCEKVGVSVRNTSVDGNDELNTRDSDPNAKREQTEACAVYKNCTCRRCGERANGRDSLVCDSCEEMFHVSCIEPAVKEIPVKSWYCVDCTACGIESPHENCVLCDRLNAPSSPTNGVGTLGELEEDLNGLDENGLELMKGGTTCNMCRSEVANDEKFRACGHAFCLHKYYHIKCLTSKQLKSYGPRWYCPSCLCRACLEDRDDDKIVLCDGCDLAYHIYCMNPPRASIPRGQWFCRKCDVGLRRVRKAKRAYESIQTNLKTIGEEGKGAFGNFENGGKEKCEEVLDSSGGVDMLLTAAKTLNYEESLAANT